ncbi:MAG: ATP synthase F1 subunit gamma [bacterium]|nr:ATP synthase F1 subunit gamma [bacterium]
MANQKAIKQKMRSVANLGKITRAMEMVARSKMKRAVDSAYATRTFSRLASELMVNLSYEQYQENPFMYPAGGSKSLLVIVGSNKGLCGGYNANMLRTLRRFVAGHSQRFDVISVGSYATSHAYKLGFSVIAEYPDVVEHTTAEITSPIARRVVSDFLDDHYDRAFIAYTDFESAFMQRPVVRALLPLTMNHLDDIVSSVGDVDERTSHDEALKGMGPKAQYVFEPDEQVILDYVIPGLVHSQIYQGILESIASEHAARMIAMKGATENVNTLHGSLTLSYNRARQASITNEIIDIAAGADAVSRS